VSVRFELIGDVHVLGALKHLRVDDVRNDGLIFARKVITKLHNRGGHASLEFIQKCSAFRVPPEKIARIYRDLHITSLDELEKTARESPKRTGNLQTS
jgi:hypothetical protein